MRFSSHHSGHLNSPGIENYPHMVTGGPEEIHNFPHMMTGTQEGSPTDPLVPLQENKRRGAPQVSHNFAVRTPLRQLKPTGFSFGDEQ